MSMEEDAALGRIAMKFVDRAGDYCDIDPAERICDEFYKAMAYAVTKHREERELLVFQSPGLFDEENINRADEWNL